MNLVAVRDGIASFESDEGKVSAPWTSLPTTFQTAHAKDRATLEANAKAAAIEAETPTAHIKVLQITPDGVLADYLHEWQGPSSESSLGAVGGGAAGESRKRLFVSYQQTILIQGLRDVEKGNSLVVRLKRDGNYDMQDSDTGRNQRIQKWTFVEKLKE